MRVCGPMHQRGDHHWRSGLKGRLQGLTPGFLIQEVWRFEKSAQMMFRKLLPLLRIQDSLIGTSFRSPSDEQDTKEQQGLMLPPPLHFLVIPALVSKPQSLLAAVLTTPPPAPSADRHQAASSPVSLPHPACFPSVKAQSPQSP